MSDLMQLVENEQTSEFYPTPEELVREMLQDVNWDYIATVLEPSAGKGDILRMVARSTEARYCRNRMDIDCIEIDANLRQILKYNFSEERKDIVKSRIRELEDLKCVWNENARKHENRISAAQKEELEELECEKQTFFENGIHIIHDNFLTYTPFKQYDLIVMNPPFSNGDVHLLKALDIQKNGGAVICLLNAETLRNPYTETRKALVKRLEELNATIKFIPNAFINAERRTSVEVALVKVSIEKKREDSEIYNRMKKAEEFNEEAYSNPYEIEVADFIKGMESRYRVEVKAGIELIRQYNAMLPYMAESFGKDNCGSILNLTVNGDTARDMHLTVNNYLRAVRMKYWKTLMANPKFTGKLTSKLREEYFRKVDSLADYDFTEFNIITLSAEMNAQVKQGIEEEIVAMYDRLTFEHSYYPETKNNRHYYDGWCTNKAHKIDKKVIIPCYGVFDAWYDRPRSYEAKSVLEDIERILNYLDGGMTREINLGEAIENNFKQGITKNIELKYFKATFYKKGTVHLTFNCPELIDRFNIYAAQNKGWLPPSYGKKTYKEMDADEKAVIDSFQGEKAYNEVLSKKGYYLAPAVNRSVLAIGIGA